MAVTAQRVVPALRVTDYTRSKAFYSGRLGFAVEWEHRFEDHLPVFASLVRDGMRLFLTEHAGDCQVGGLVHFYVPDVDALDRELRSCGVAAAEPPNDELEGLRCMTVCDPDGNQLRFLTPTGGADTEPGAAADGGGRVGC